MMRALLVALAFIVSVPAEKGRADWRGFYTPTERPRSEVTRGAGDPRGICLAEILRAELRYQIPGNLLLAIGLQESGLMTGGDLTVWPWTVNVEGAGQHYATRGEAERAVMDEVGAGKRSIDVGCMQVNLHWHPDAFDDLREGFEPARNVDYAARYLLRLYGETGDWLKAAGRYHSATQKFQSVYLDRLRTNAMIAHDRIDEFRALAAEGTGRRVVQAAPREPLPEGHFWTAWMTGKAAEGQGQRSLYARGALEPVLPNFKKMF